MIRLSLCVCVLVVAVFAGNPCQMSTQYPGACVCDDKYCDTIEPVGQLDTNTAALYQSSKAGDRLTRSTLSLNTKRSRADASATTLSVKVNTSQTYQAIIGFGGALTDASAVNYAQLSPQLQDHVINSYYGKDGIQYSLGRVPMASCDFSTHVYSYDEVPGDFQLDQFSIDMDHEYKLPLINTVLKESSRNVTLFASSWSAPAWMKTNHNRLAGGKLNGTAGDQTHQAWALYFSKFLTAYAKEGIDFWGVTVQNEPTSLVRWESMEFTAETERDFIAKDLGPTLRRDHPDVKIMMHDDQRNIVAQWADTVLADQTASQYVDGVAVHWYAAVEDILPEYEQLSVVHNKHPTKFILPTEACNGYIPLDQGPKMGYWKYGDIYAYDIIGDLQNYASGWTDWNILLDMQGGPNHVGNVVDSPMIADVKNGSVLYKQPMFYALGHFSKFIPAGSVRVHIDFGTSSATTKVFGTAFLVDLTGAGSFTHTVVVLLNRDHANTYALDLSVDSAMLSATLPPTSIQTYVLLRAASPQ